MGPSSQRALEEFRIEFNSTLVSQPIPWAEDLGGVLRIGEMSGQMAQAGLVTLIWFMAMISVNLGLINLFPVPMLDGGHLLFYSFEALRGKPLGEKFQEYGFRVGLVMVLSLMVFATWNDLVHFRIVAFVSGLLS
jgi:regulator of sigma E protease